MEDLKPLNPDTDGCAIQARFTDFCKNGLSLVDDTTTEAMKVFNESKHLLLADLSGFRSEMQEEVERCWFAFILYSVKKLSKGNAVNVKQTSNESGITLCQLLKVAKLNIVVFLKVLPQLIVKYGTILSNLYGSDWERRLEAKELQTNFVQLSLLSKYYKDAFQEFFLINDTNVDQPSHASGATGYMSDYHRFGWLLFLALRIHTFSRFKDLVTCINGLISVLAVLIIHVPIRLRNFTIHNSQHFVLKSGQGVDLLASLSKKYDTPEDELVKAMEKVNNLIVDILEKTRCSARKCTTGNLDGINPGGLTYFNDLITDESSLISCISILEKDCDNAINNKGDLDEMIFANESSLIGSGSFSGGTKRKFECTSSPAKTITSTLSPQRSPSTCPANGIPGSSSKMVSTPVSTAMTTAKWLRTVVSSLPSNPSPALEGFLLSCDRGMNGDVIRRAHIMLEAIFPNDTLPNANRIDNVWAEQRRMEALKLYYRVLESICAAESQTNNLSSLLTNERFHRCMLACSAELVLATHKAVTMLFPAVLERTGVTPFDFSKVIESFIRHEESLPRELRRHLNSLEERLLECMVWEKGSSMYNSLIVARPSLSAEIIRLGLLAEPMMSLDAIAMHMKGLPVAASFQNHTASPGQIGELVSPKKVCGGYRSVLAERNSFASPVKECLLGFNNLKSKPPPLQSAFATPTRPNPDGRGETCAETEINIFFSKIVKLAAVRINGMVERLQLSQQIRDNVYCLVRKILTQQTSLFFNRHIDQLILCCFYGVAKISQLNLTFKEIIYSYRKQPQCKPRVFRNVFVDWSSAQRNERTGREFVDIISFYNDLFVPTVKPLLVELGPSGPTQKPPDGELHRNNDGHCPESPKVSGFPSLPDMSPKKVSAVHNVYVSPLRSSKREALITHASKSYYACVGESTHAYQSPSKDLTAINKQLNSGSRKLRGMLNLDGDAGLVSDSLAANALCPQTANAAAVKPEPS